MNLNVSFIDYDKESSILRVEMVEAFVAGQNYTVEIHYRGVINAASEGGLFRSFYQTTEGEKR